MKKFWLIGLLLTLSLVAAQCTAAATPEPAAAPTTAPAEPAATPEEAMKEEPTVAPTEEAMMGLGEPLKIGVLSDLTGPLALFGNETWEGLQIGFDYATDGKMVAGNRPIELIIRDTTADVETGSAAARELIESEGVEVLVGASSSGVAQQVQQIADENEVVYLAAPAASPAITGDNWNPHTFRVCRNGAQDSAVMANWAITNVGTDYLILAEDYAFGQALAAGFVASFTAAGGNFLDETIFAPGDTTDFTPYIQEIKTADPDGLILIWATNTSAVTLFEQLTAQGVTGSIPYVTGFFSNDVVKTLDPGLIGATGYIVYHYSLPKTESNDYLTAQYLERFGGPPDLFSECGFATAQAVVAALDATGGETDSATLIAALEGLTFEGPRGTYTIRAEDHQALAPQYIVKLANIDDPDDKFFELVEEVSAEDSAPPCTAPGRCE